MKEVYPIIISKEKDGYYVEIPTFNTATQGNNLADAIFMARDAIGLLGITIEDSGEEIPKPVLENIEKQKDTDILTLVDVDFSEYRKKHDNRTVKKNCTVPYWLCCEAEKEGINFSQTLQEALKEKLGIK